MTDTSTITDLTLDIPYAQLHDSHQRLLNTRWPDQETVNDTSQGPELEKIKALIEHWAVRYDRRKTETLLNS